MRLKTSHTLRSIDNWKMKLDISQHRYLGSLAILVGAAGIAGIRGFIISLFILGVSVNFAFAQFGLFVLLGFLIIKLNFYRFANIFLRITGREKSLSLS